MENAIVHSLKTAVDDFFEQKIEFDIVIPDYSPAAEKILSCTVTPALLSHSSDGGRITVDIGCKANIIYTDEDGCVRSVSKTETFSKNIPEAVSVDTYRIKSGIRPISVNCRMQSSRRITARAVIGTALKVLGNCEMNVASADDGIEAVYRDISAKTFAGFGDTVCNISGNISAKEGIVDIIQSGGTVKITDMNTVTSKAVIKGIAEIYIVYTVGEGTDNFCFAEGTIHFSDVIDIDGASDSAECIVNAALTDIKCETVGDSGQIAVEAEAFITASAYNNADLSLMSDAYSLSQPVDITTADVTVESFDSCDKFTETVSGSFLSEFENARIIGMTANAVIKSISPRDSMLAIDGDIVLSVYMCNESEYKICERTVPFSALRSMPSADGNIRCEASAVVGSLSYTMPDNDNINITAEVEFELCCFCSNVYPVITDIVPSDSEDGKLCKGIMLYFAEQGESLWEIAKKYRSSVNTIRQDNNIDGDFIQSDKMLLIAYN